MRLRGSNDSCFFVMVLMLEKILDSYVHRYSRLSLKKKVRKKARLLYSLNRRSYKFPFRCHSPFSVVKVLEKCEQGIFYPEEDVL